MTLGEVMGFKLGDEFHWHGQLATVRWVDSYDEGSEGGKGWAMYFSLEKSGVTLRTYNPGNTSLDLPQYTA